MTDLERVCQFLRERAAWLKYERDHGGDHVTMSIHESECAFLERSIRTGRYMEDGRPSWLRDIPIPPVAAGSTDPRNFGGMA